MERCGARGPAFGKADTRRLAGASHRRRAGSNRAFPRAARLVHARRTRGNGARGETARNQRTGQSGTGGRIGQEDRAQAADSRRARSARARADLLPASLVGLCVAGEHGTGRRRPDATVGTTRPPRPQASPDRIRRADMLTSGERDLSRALTSTRNLHHVPHRASGLKVPDSTARIVRRAARVARHGEKAPPRKRRSCGSFPVRWTAGACPQSPES